jgi:predicted nucleic acid-binding protein
VTISKIMSYIQRKSEWLHRAAKTRLWSGLSRIGTLSVSPDEADNRFLECAGEAQADYLVTGNKRHFPKRWKSTQVVNARELLELIGVKLP